MTPESVRDLLRASELYRDIPARVAGSVVAVGGLAGSAKALVLACLREDEGRALIVCCGDECEVEDFREDLLLFSPDARSRPAPLVLPIHEESEEEACELTSLLARRAVFDALEPRGVLLAEISSLMAPIGARSEASGEHLTLARGERRDPRELCERAEAAGMRRVAQVALPGEVALRGDVFDVWPLGQEKPLRVELFDDEIESLRRFDPDGQGSTGECDEVEIVLPRPNPPDSTETTWLLDLCEQERHIIVVVEPTRFEEQLSRFTLRSGTRSAQVASFEAGIARCAALSLSTLPATAGHDLHTAAPVLSTGAGFDLKGRVLAAGKLSERPLVVLRSRAEADRVLRVARETSGTTDAGFDTCVGHLARGFRLPELGRAVLNHGEFFGTGVARRRWTTKKQSSRVASRVLQSFFELEEGDLVVHAVHGIARFVGFERTNRGVGAGEEDHLRLRFADDVEVLVPASKIDLVQKYVGSGQAAPKLDKVGGKSFGRRKDQVAHALLDMAADLLELQVERMRRPGVSCPEEDELADEFDRSFPFEDTPDQAKSCAEISKDLCSPKPMDRLLCGDVGFGKTELAVRAAFRTVSAGRQVALLAPTTLLADQHGRTFRDRMASFGVSVEVVSRLQSRKQIRATLDRAKNRLVDVVIGTHRLLSSDVEIGDLGLLVVDEEQRFGVAHKEAIRRLRTNVDVLTLTATPIPRTLHMALLGIKDISSLATPPPGRLEISTRVVPRAPATIRDACLAEIARGGQVFFLHNRVKSIQVVRQELEALCPSARIVVGHGQMGERELLSSMQLFLSGEADILLSTTIVESGIDIPRANTILIDNAQHFGLADLHQLRGRVGRDVHHAHCILLVDPTTPMTAEARSRLQALERFSALGSGFAIAMRDLEIRGAGNLLGPEQSGHIAAVGYDMYCKLLQAAVQRTTGGEPAAALSELFAPEDVDVDLGVAAFVPTEFVAEERPRLALLRELSEGCDARGIDALRASLADRFGRIPTPLANLCSLFLVKHELGQRGLSAVRFHPPDQLVLSHQPGRGPQGAWLGAFADVRPVSPGRTHLCLPEGEREPERVLALLESALCRSHSGARLRGS